MSVEPARPKISDDLVEYFASGVDVYVATRGPDLMPESVLGMGIRVHPDRSAVTVYLPKVTCESTLANLADNGRIAATLVRPVDHRSVQLKGRCTNVRDSDQGDREVQEIFRAALVEAFALVGVPRVFTRGLPWWPSAAVEFRVSDVYTQTPGPNAGAPLLG